VIYVVTRDGRTTTVRTTSDATGDHLPELDTLVGTGVARCRRDDVQSGRVGTTIALGRALQDLGRQLEAAGLARTVSLDEMDRVADILSDTLEEMIIDVPAGSTVSWADLTTIELGG